MIDEAIEEFYNQTGRMPVKALVGQSIWIEVANSLQGHLLPMFVRVTEPIESAKELGYLYKNVHFILIIDRPDERLLRLL